MTSSAHFIDPEELPFTRDDVYRAARLWEFETVASSMADGFARAGKGLLEDRAERRARLRADGVPNADTMRFHEWSLPDYLLPALSALSPDCDRRARVLAESDWALRREATLQGEQRRAAVRDGLWPTREELDAELRAHGLAPDQQGTPDFLAVGGLPPLPPPTPEMVSAVDALEREWRAAWDELAATSRKRLANSPHLRR